MSNDRTQERLQDGSYVSAVRTCSARVLAKKHGITVSRAERLIQEHGNNNSVLDAAAESLKAAGIPDADRARRPAGERAQVTDATVKPLLEKELADMRSKTNRLKAERLAAPQPQVAGKPAKKSGVLSKPPVGSSLPKNAN